MIGDPACPSCGSGDCTVMGLEDGSIRYRCQHCLNDWLDAGPDLKLCDTPDCENWVQEGIAYCTQCVRKGAASVN